MRKLLFVTITLLFCAISTVFSEVAYEVRDNGRRIQLDGFLLEWKTALAKPFGKNGEFACDAFKTPEGLSGYCKSMNPVSCGEWTFAIKNNLDNTEIVKIICSRNAETDKNSFYQYDHDRFMSSGQLITEWVVPWDKLCLQGKDTFNIVITTTNACGDTLPQLMLRGNRKSGDNKSVWSGTAFRAGAIAVLTVIFVAVRRKIRKQMSRKV